MQKSSTMVSCKRSNLVLFATVVVVAMSDSALSAETETSVGAVRVSGRRRADLKPTLDGKSGGSLRYGPDLRNAPTKWLKLDTTETAFNHKVWEQPERRYIRGLYGSHHAYGHESPVYRGGPAPVSQETKRLQKDETARTRELNTFLAYVNDVRSQTVTLLQSMRTRGRWVYVRRPTGTRGTSGSHPPFRGQTFGQDPRRRNDDGDRLRNALRAGHAARVGAAGHRLRQRRLSTERHLSAITIDD